MRVFVSEFLVGGACIGSDASPSMRREGLAMVQAVTEDLARLPGVRVVTTIDANLTTSLTGEVIRVENAEHEQVVFGQLLSEADAVLVIAPETDGILAARCRQVCEAGVQSWNCSPSCIELCGDKLKLAEHLQMHRLRTIPTARLDLGRPYPDQIGPFVLKPRDGAGSNCTFLVRNREEFELATCAFRQAKIDDRCLIQPWIKGRSLSVGGVFGLVHRHIRVLPIAEQHLSSDGRFRYLGGTIPADVSAADQAAVEELVLTACDCIPGLRGYVGFDVILPDGQPPILVEINPRLTTSYVGYRQLFAEPLPKLWISSADFPQPRSERIHFDV